MPTRLEDRFIEAEGSPIEVDGQRVQMMFELPPIKEPGELRIQLEARAERPQGVRLKARQGKLLLNDQKLDDVVLWSDTAPPTVIASLRPDSSGKPMTVRVWNAWRDPAGTMQAWIGDAGLIVEEHADQVVLRCSDGFDAPKFDDLVVTLAVDAGE